MITPARLGTITMSAYTYFGALMKILSMLLLSVIFLTDASAGVQRIMESKDVDKFLNDFKINFSQDPQINSLATDVVCEYLKKQSFAENTRLMISPLKMHLALTESIFSNALSNITKNLKEGIIKECALPKEKRSIGKIAMMCVDQNNQINVKVPLNHHQKTIEHLCLQYMDQIKISYESAIQGIIALKNQKENSNANDCTGVVADPARSAKNFLPESNSKLDDFKTKAK